MDYPGEVIEVGRNGDSSVYDEGILTECQAEAIDYLRAGGGEEQGQTKILCGVVLG